MHKIDVIVLGPNNFFLTLNELRPYLKFNVIFFDNKPFKDDLYEQNFLLCHHEYLADGQKIDFVKKSKCIKILATNKNEKNYSFFNKIIQLPISVKDLNYCIENIASKKVFSENSSIKIKNYTLDKNEKKLSKDRNNLNLTEKEIQLLELFLKNTKPVSKKEILSLVWHYATDADTHTVETHIYRLRKKIIDKFNDERFILNNKEGYYLWEKEIK